MPNVKFNLKNKQEDETLVILVFRYDGNKLVYSTGQKINPKLWNDKAQKARESSKFPEFPEFNAFLKKIELETQNIYRKHKIESLPLNNDIFKEQLNEALGKTERAKIPTFLEFVEQFIERKINAGKPKGSIQVYKKTLKHLKGYEKVYGKLDYHNIDFLFLDNFQNYLYSEPRSLSINYSKKILQNVKLFLNKAKDLKHHDNTTYNHRDFTIKEEEIDHIYLNENDLQKLLALNLSSNKRLDRVRDLFLIGCYTGLRYSDFSKLENRHLKKFDDDFMIEVITQKTRQKVVIPIHPKVQKIIEKYKATLPTLSNQKMNNYIKEVCKLAGINDSTTVVRTKGFRKEEQILPKYKRVSSHTARRSFASNAYKAGVPPRGIMSITGHKTEASFLKYIRLSQEEQALLMASHSFFKN